ncbi:hypothetical protein [Kibdelosporangium philippinense]|uniref:hypothetical protein n=1 Tax=Kibdelosporangium philippinense TaxID=211113 RepID=UPI00360B7C82
MSLAHVGVGFCSATGACAPLEASDTAPVLTFGAVHAATSNGMAQIAIRWRMVPLSVAWRLDSAA